MTPLAGAILMKMLSVYGNSAVAALGAAQRVESILILVLMALTSALTPFMAQNFGANQPQRSFQGLFLSMRFSIVFQLLIFIIMVPLSVPISALFSQEAHVKHLLWQYLLIVPASYGFQGILMMLSSALNALHRPLLAFQWNAMRLFLFTCRVHGWEAIGMALKGYLSVLRWVMLSVGAWGICMPCTYVGATVR